MRCFYSTRFRSYRPLYPALKFFLLSDLHFSPKVTNRTLDAIAHQAKIQKPDFITFSGDLIDSIESVTDQTERTRLFSWLAQLGNFAPVLLALGNHDSYKKSPHFTSALSRKKHWLICDNSALIADLSALKNVHILDNKAYEDNRAYIFGLTLPPAYYQLDRDQNRSSTILHPGGEDKTVFLSTLHALNQKFYQNLPQHKAKIALIHSPIYLDDPEITPFFNEFDFIICGHMHNGIVPPILNELWPSDRGLFAPGKHLFPHRSRQSKKLQNPKLLLCGAITTIQACAKPVAFLNAAFPVNIATLEFTKNPIYAKKLDTKRQYLSF